MNINITKLYNRNFSFMVIGQVISLFGNAILRFSLSLYVLETTGSATIFASILAISIIPTILLSPIGGVIADRVSRKHIMLVLDFLTSFMILVFSWLMSDTLPIFAIGVVMVLLSIIQACYQPSVQASIPLLASEEHLMQANGIVVQVNALANLVGPIVGGMLYTLLPFTMLLWISAAAFFSSAILECLMQIPFTKMAKSNNAYGMAIQDLKDGMHFIVKKRPVLFRLLFILAGLNLVLSSLMTVGLPVISNIILALPAQYYGWLQAGSAIGMIIGSLLIPLFNKKFTIKTSYMMLLFASLCMIPMGLALLLHDQVYLTYAIILVSTIIALLFSTVFNVYAQTYMQQITPNELLGKVSSFVTMIVMCSYPVGQAIYGMLFDSLRSQAPFIIFGAALIAIFISLKTKSSLQRI